MPAIKGERPFLGQTNEARKENAKIRRDSLLFYLTEIENRTNIDHLALKFRVSVRTIKYDITYLIKNGHLDVIKSKLSENGHAKISNEEASNIIQRFKSGENLDIISEEFSVSSHTLKKLIRGNQSRSNGIHYNNLNVFNRGRLDYTEYQVLTAIKENPGETPTNLYKTYKSKFYCPCSYSSFMTAIYRLKNLSRIFAVPKSCKINSWFPYFVNPKEMWCNWTTSTGVSKRERKSLHPNLKLTNYSSYVDKSVCDVITFSGINKNRLNRKKFFSVEFNKTCRSINRNGARCGGQIVRGKDGVAYCKACGLVDETRYISATELSKSIVET